VNERCAGFTGNVSVQPFDGSFQFFVFVGPCRKVPLCPALDLASAIAFGFA
jgi:hypothetical protein